MLEQLLGEFSNKFPSPSLAWRRYLEYLAVESRGSLYHRLNHKFEWFHEDDSFSEKVIALHKPKLLRSDYHDHLGELYVEFSKKHFPKRERLYDLIPMEVADDVANTLVGPTDERKSIFIPHTGTGRLMMAVQRLAPNSILFGAEPTLSLYRIAYTNICIHRLSANIIPADPEKYELDISTEAGFENWRQANGWYQINGSLRRKAGQKTVAS